MWIFIRTVNSKGTRGDVQMKDETPNIPDLL